MKGYLNIMCAVVVLGSCVTAVADSKSLENLERERVDLMNVVLDASLSVEERSQRIGVSEQRLVDLERMVMRDDRLMGSKAPLVRRAFADYDGTFLVHASVESKRHIVDFWMHTLGLDTASIMGSRKGRR